jgi:ATP-dependent helicase/nuclease subunit B
MGKKVITGRLHFDLETALFEHISRLRTLDSVSSLYVLVGSNLLGAYLRRRFAERTGGHINVRFLTFADMAALLDDPLARLVLPFAERAIVEGMIAGGDLPPAFEGAISSAGFGEALLVTFTDLSEAGCTAATAKKIADGTLAHPLFGERTKGLFDLYGRFIDAVEELGGDLQSRFRRAAERAEKGAMRLETAGPVLAYGFYDFNRLQLRLLESLDAGPGITVFMPWAGGESGRFAEGTLERLERCGFTRQAIEENGRPTPAIEILSAPGEEEEARALVRRILSHVEDRKTRLGGIGLLVPSKEIYLPLFAEAFDEAGIPYNCRDGGAGPARRVAQGVGALMKLIGGDIERGALVDFLVSAPLRPVDGAPGAYRLWVKKSAEAGMVGEGGWRTENRILCERLGRAVAEGRETDETLRSIESVDRLVAQIEHAQAGVRTGGTWSRFSAILLGAVEALFGAGGHISDIEEVIGRLGELDAVSSPVSFATYCRILRPLLSSLDEGAGRKEGVSILSLGEARGISFEYVLIPGLAEKIFPTIPRQDPFLTDRERSEINLLTGGEVFLPERFERLDEEALICSLALDSATEGLVCSYPRMEQETGRERIESSFLRFVEGYSLLGDGLRPKRLHRFGRSDDEPSSGLEYDYLRAMRGGPFTPRSRFFGRAVRMETARRGRGAFTPFEGVFSSREALEALRSRLERSRWRFSPTSLERYAECPFYYFLANILELDVVEEPERLIRITPLARGTIIHEILSGLFERLKENGILPLCPSVRDEALPLAEGVAAAILEEYSRREPTGFPVFWEIEKRTTVEVIRRYLEEEVREASALVPTHFEKVFGEDPSPSIETEKGTVSFRGRIDRIDIGTDGAFKVIDYKTGRRLDKDQDLAGGTRLQLPVYLIAASALLARPISRGVAVYRRVGGGNGRREVVFSGEHWRESEEEFKRIIETIVGGIERGLFMAGSPDSCENCSVRSACLSEARRTFESKAPADGRCMDYLAMRGLTEEEE